ncbi:hypothetical protein LTR84_001421 [Exophiala bonariae]|uniref:Uncharacterized protein n=1 Tax=Exophiala bonariae TaxID=1690606 RepID=A0AAV9NCL2_9EURO|nr:hypothetical protein LTR84_001421 [Exophiala bonariae]
MANKAGKTGGFWNLDDPVAQELLKDGRGVMDILVKILSIHCATTIIVGHLTSLKNTPSYALTVPVIAFILAPMYPLAELLVDIYRSAQTYLSEKSDRADFQYYVAVGLGMRASPIRDHSQEGVKLLELSTNRFLLRRKTKPRGILWAARVGVLLAFLVQDVGVISLYFRRLKVIPPKLGQLPRLLQHADADFDNVNALFALGSLVAAFVCLLLELTNWTWTYSPMGLRGRAVPIETEWYEFFKLETPHLPEIVLTQILTTCASSPLILRNVAFGASFVADVAGGEQSVLEIVLNLHMFLALLSVILGGLAMCPPQWAYKLRIQPEVINAFLYITAMAGLALVRLNGIVGSCEDIAAVRACSRGDASWCVAAFLWRDPREGSLWAL